MVKNARDLLNEVKALTAPYWPVAPWPENGPVFALSDSCWWPVVDKGLPEGLYWLLWHSRTIRLDIIAEEPERMRMDPQATHRALRAYWELRAELGHQSRRILEEQEEEMARIRREVGLMQLAGIPMSTLESLHHWAPLACRMVAIMHLPLTGAFQSEPAGQHTMPHRVWPITPRLKLLAAIWPGATRADRYFFSMEESGYRPSTVASCCRWLNDRPWLAPTPRSILDGMNRLDRILQTGGRDATL